MAGYGSDDGFSAWLAANGYSLPEGAPTPAVLRQRGSAYVDGVYGPRALGSPTDGYAQERAWPRTGATAYGSAIPVDAIPNAWVEASYAAALYEAQNPGGLAVVATPGQAVKREKVGSLEVEYQTVQGGALEAATPMLLTVEGLVAPFLYSTERAPMILVV